MYVKAYRAARMRLSNHAIAKALGIMPSTMGIWMAENEAFREAVEQGRRDDSGLGLFRAFYQQRLSPECRAYWDELVQSDPRARARAKRKLGDAGLRMRQQVYLFTLMECDMAASKARAIADVQKHEVDAWLLDPKFALLLEEVQECKKDFFETSFIGLVASGVPEAIIHAARTVNRDRGYGDKVTVEHSQKESSQRNQQALSNLSPEELKLLAGLMDKMRGTPPLVRKPQALIGSRKKPTIQERNAPTDVAFEPNGEE